MSHTLSIGYQRLPNGSAVPICEPAIDAFLLHLWQHAASARIPEKFSRYLISAEISEARARVEGHLAPEELARDVVRMIGEGIHAMRETIKAIEATYPADTFARTVLARTGTRLYLQPDSLVVTTKPPIPHPRGIGFDAPTVHIEENGRTTVLVTGHPRSHPVATWADALVCERVRGAILSELTRLSAVGGAAES